MHQPIGWGSGRSTVALSLSRGVVGTPEGGHMDAGVGARYCSVSVLPSDPASSSVRGLGMVRRCSNTNQHELSPIGSSLNVLAVRTPFITVEGSESGDTLPYTTYIKSLGDHIATALLSCDGAELITVAHGPTGSGKSTQLFGSSLSPAADTGGIFSDVLQRIFATSRYEAGFSPCVAISVVEWRSMYSPSGSSKANVFASHSNRIIEDSFDGHCSCLFDEGVAHAMEARDLLSRTRDRSSPTGCFMEDYADIPAARYVSCTSTREVLEVLHEAFRYSHAWRVVGGVPDDAVLAVQTPNESLPGSHAPASSSAVLCPVTGSSTHVLVTLLIRRVDRAGGRSAWGIWRLWDLCGPAGAPDDVSSAAASTHTSLCHMAKCIVRSGERFSGTWLAVTGTTKLLPGFISDMIPLISTASLSESARGDRGEKSLSGTGVEKVTAMIEAVMQHSCSSVVWIGSLRRDPSFDTVNEGVLEAAAAIAAYGGIADTTALTELRRQRRAENLRAAERVMDIFTIPFESFHEQPAVGKQRAPRGADHIGDDLSTPNGKTTRVGNVASVRRKFRLVSPTPTVEAPTSLSQLSDPSPSRSLPLPSSSQASVDKSSGDDFAHRGSHPDGWDSCGHCPVVDAPTEDIADTGLPGSVVGVDVRTDCVDISCVSAAEASSFVPQRELETVAHVLQHLLGPPLAQLRLTSEHHREQLQQQQRVIAQLNELLYSSGLILGEMRVQEQRQEKLLNAIERNNLLERRLQKLEHENNRLRAQLKLSHENSGVACTGKCATGHRAASASASGHTVGAGLGVLLSEKHHERNDGTFSVGRMVGGEGRSIPRTAFETPELPRDGVVEHQGYMEVCCLTDTSGPPGNVTHEGHGSTCGPLGRQNGGSEATVSALSVDPVPSSKKSKHLLNVLMRATKVLPTATDPIQHCGKSLVRTSKLSEGVTVMQARPNPESQLSERAEVSITSEGSVDICADLRTFREAVAAAKEGALKALHVAREAVRETYAHSLSSRAVSTNNEEADQGISNVTGASVHDSTNECELHDLWDELGQQEVNVSRALDTLQRGASALEHSTIDVMVREKRMLSRIVFE